MSETGLSNFVPAETNLSVVGDTLGGGNYLPYVKLCGSNSEEAKSGVVGMGCFALKEGEKVTDLGNEIVPVVIAARATAMDFEGEDGVIVSHDPKSEEYARIKIKGDLPGMSKAIYGPEFLMYLEGCGFVQYHCGSKSARRAATDLVALCSQTVDGVKKFIPTAVRFGSKLVKHTPRKSKTEYSFHIPVFEKYDGEIPEASFTPEEYTQVVDDFLNPKEQVAEAGDIEDDRG